MTNPKKEKVPGRSNFSHTTQFTTDTEASRQWVLMTLTPWIASEGFQPLPSASPDQTIFEGKYLSLAAFFFGLITFPIGILIWVLAQSKKTLSITMSPLSDNATQVTFVGTKCPNTIRSWVESL